MNPSKPASLLLLTALSLLAITPLHAVEPARREKMKEKILEKYDTNQDGILNDDEKAAMKAEVIKKFDKNGDGKIDESEKQAARETLKTKLQQKKTT